MDTTDTPAPIELAAMRADFVAAKKRIEHHALALIEALLTLSKVGGALERLSATDAHGDFLEE